MKLGFAVVNHRPVVHISWLQAILNRPKLSDPLPDPADFKADWSHMKKGTVKNLDQPRTEFFKDYRFFFVIEDLESEALMQDAGAEVGRQCLLVENLSPTQTCPPADHVPTHAGITQVEKAYEWSDEDIANLNMESFSGMCIVVDPGRIKDDQDSTYPEKIKALCAHGLSVTTKSALAMSIFSYEKLQIRDASGKLVTGLTQASQGR